MAITPNSMLEWTLLTVKPENTDRVNPTYDIDADEQKCQLYSDFKALLVLRDEDHGIDANHTYLTGKKLKFGSAAEFQLSHNATDMFFEDVAPAAKIKFRYNTATLGSPSMANFLTLDPVNDSIATYGNATNYDGAAGKGLIFAVTTNRAKFTERLTTEDLLVAEGGIQMLLKNISYTGAADTGLEFDITNIGYFKQKLVCEADLDVTGQINANKAGEWSIRCDGKSFFTDNMRVGANWISYTGGDAGMHFDAANGTDFSGAMDVSGRIYCFSNIYAESQIHSDTYINAAQLFKCGGTSGITYNGPISTINIKGGMVIGYT